ncbi:Inorganic phosphate transporter pho84 [Tulasnella sp. 331]|nr:Inorganic phosphate transporter pho84 [Tulasnella sp. 331]KAG8877605.1 Inorganic phosphate transporter pho84 [Tulasnella sp. 332]
MATVNTHTPEINSAERRRAALAEVDNAPFGWYHVKTCLIAGVGFFTDAYDIFAINLCSAMIGTIYSKGGKVTANQDLGLKVASPVGTLVGQLLFGWLADVVGRKKMYGVELMLILVATFGQVVAGHGPGVNIFGVLILWRFIMGIGIGGDYPLSAIITSEFAATKFRGRMMNAVFAMQGFGQLSAAVVATIVLSAFKSAIERQADHHSIDYVWRIVIGIGMIPGAIALYYRLTIPETPRYTMDVERNLEQAEQDADFIKSGKFERIEDRVTQKVEVPKATRRDFMRYYSKWSNLKVLIGTSYSWFALDIAFYGLGLNSSIILTNIGFGSSSSKNPNVKVYETLFNACVGNIILSVAGLIPGYWVSFALIDFWGRKPIQLMGFIMLTIIFVILGFGYDALTKHSVGAFIFLYCLANFFQNFGPNSTTFIIPGEVFPTRYRSTSHGISAASGKLGAIIAQVGFARLKDIGGATGSGAFIKHIMEIFAFFMLTGIFSTLLLPETKGKTLEQLNGEEDPEDEFVHHDHEKHSGSDLGSGLRERKNASADV